MSQEVEDMIKIDKKDNMVVIEVIAEIEETMVVQEPDSSTMETSAGQGGETPEVIARRL